MELIPAMPPAAAVPERKAVGRDQKQETAAMTPQVATVRARKLWRGEPADAALVANANVEEAQHPLQIERRQAGVGVVPWAHGDARDTPELAATLRGHDRRV